MSSPGLETFFTISVMKHKIRKDTYNRNSDRTKQWQHWRAKKSSKNKISFATTRIEQKKERINGKMWYNGSQCTASQMVTDVVAKKKKEKKCGE